MILPRYVTAIATLDRDTALSFLVRRHLKLDTCAPRKRPVLYALSAAGLGQADLVCALLHVNNCAARRLIALILGRPIVVAPCVLLQWRVNGRAPTVRRPRVVGVAMTNPRKPNTPAHARFQMAFKAGRSLEEVRLRGATKRDIRQAIRNHWIEVAAA